MRVALLGPIGLVTLAACSSAPLRWSNDLDAAIARAKSENRPLYVLSLFGDLSKKC